MNQAKPGSYPAAVQVCRRYSRDKGPSSDGIDSSSSPIPFSSSPSSCPLPELLPLSGHCAWPLTWYQYQYHTLQ